MAEKNPTTLFALRRLIFHTPKLNTWHESGNYFQWKGRHTQTEEINNCMNAEALQTESSLTIKIFSMHTRGKVRVFHSLVHVPSGDKPYKKTLQTAWKSLRVRWEIEVGAWTSQRSLLSYANQTKHFLSFAVRRVVKKNVVSDTGIFSAAGRVILQSERRGILLIFLDVKIFQSFVQTQTGNESLVS